MLILQIVLMGILTKTYANFSSNKSDLICINYLSSLVVKNYTGDRTEAIKKSTRYLWFKEVQKDCLNVLAQKYNVEIKADDLINYWVSYATNLREDQRDFEAPIDTHNDEKFFKSYEFAIFDWVRNTHMVPCVIEQMGFNRSLEKFEFTLAFNLDQTPLVQYRMGIETGELAHYPRMLFEFLFKKQWNSTSIDKISQKTQLENFRRESSSCIDEKLSTAMATCEESGKNVFTRKAKRFIISQDRCRFLKNARPSNSTVMLAMSISAQGRDHIDKAFKDSLRETSIDEKCLKGKTVAKKVMCQCTREMYEKKMVF